MNEISLEKKTNQTPTRERRISAKVRKAVQLWASGDYKFQKDAAKAAGIREETLSTVLKTARVQAFIAQETRKKLGSLPLRAAHRLEKLLFSASDHVGLGAVELSLDIAGHVPKKNGNQPLVNINLVTPGYVIDLTGRQAGGSDARVIEHLPPNDAKALPPKDNSQD